LKTPPCESPLACHRFLETLTDIALRELAARHELLWPLSTPCLLPEPDRIACARFENAAENLRRRKLREKYPVEMLTGCCAGSRATGNFRRSGRAAI